MSVISQHVVDMITGELKPGGPKHWKTGHALTVQNGKVLVTVEGKTIDIFRRDISNRDEAGGLNP